MKNFSIILVGLTLLLMPVGRIIAQAPAPAKAAPPAVVPPRSVFTQPNSPREGRDPFCPESTRVFDAMASTHAATEVATTLAVKGYSMSNGRPMVIINNHTFTTGDEGDVLSGPNRTHIRCIEIRPGTVVVDVNGARHEIHF